DEYGPVGEGRYPILLEEDLDHVGEYLGQAEGAYPVGSVAVLPEAEEPALEPYEACGDRQRRDEHGNDDDKGEDEEEVFLADEWRRHLVEIGDGLLSVRLDQPCAGVAACQGPSHFGLELV